MADDIVYCLLYFAAQVQSVSFRRKLVQEPVSSQQRDQHQRQVLFRN